MSPLVLLTVLVACSGDAIPTSPEGPEQNRLVATVEVEPPYLEIGPDDLGFLDAVVKSARGRVVNGRSVQWRSSDPSVVSIEPDGRVTGVNEGEAEIYAQVEGRRGSAAIKVRGTVIGIEMPEQILASEGATKQVQAIFRYRNGATRPAGRVKWSSENPTIVTIDGDGLLHARTTGSTTIVAFARGHSRESGVQVNASAVASLQLSSTSLELEPGETEQLWAEVLDANGNRLDKKVVWSSYDASVATVDGDGLVTAIAVGGATIEAKSGGETATADVQVVESSTDDGSTTTSSAAGTPSQVRDLRVTGADDHSVTLAFTQVDDGAGSPADYVVRYGLPSISWSSASNVTKGSCAGSVSGTSIGASLSCTVDALQASTDYEFMVVAYRGTLGSDAVFGPPSNVAAGTTDDPPVFVDVSPSYLELDEGQSGDLDAEVTDAYGNPLSGYTVTWNSSNTTVATVDEHGRVTAQAAGNASVRASVDGDVDDASVDVNQTTTSTSDGGSTGDSGSTSDDGATSGGGSSDDTDDSLGGVVPAFPGAEGYGAMALSQCRSLPLEVRYVTNLNDGGSGSFQEAVTGSSGDKYTIVIFRTGGTITGRGFAIDKPCLYIAGQTAPGGGIQFRAPDDPTHRVTLLSTLRDRSARDLVIRYLRLRPGRGEPAVGDVFRLTSGTNIVLDHLSTAFGNDESVSPFAVALSAGGEEIDKLTIQWSMITTTLYPHAAGSLLGSNWGSADVKDVTVHHNAFIHNSGRNPEVKRGYRIQVINNVVYNWGKSRVGQTWGDATADFIGNYWKQGPISADNLYRHRLQDEWTQYPRLYVSGNVMSPDVRDIATDQRNFIFIFDGDSRTDLGPLPNSSFMSSPISAPTVPVTVQSASGAYSSVLGSAGANRRLDCRGDWVQVRDKLDGLLVSHVQNRNGPTTETESDHQSDYGGIPSLSGGTACSDRDGDGMPDDFESRYGLDPNNASDAGRDPDGDGYLNLEEYLNGTAPR